MTRVDQIRKAVEHVPLTGAQIREQVGGTATQVHRYLCELRRRGQLFATRRAGTLIYSVRPFRADEPVVLGWSRDVL
jgi:hypothetical protein